MDRRSFLFGAAASLVAAPAIVRAASLMPVKSVIWWDEINIYGTSPGWAALPTVQELNEMRMKIIQRMTYPGYFINADGSLTQMDTKPDEAALRLFDRCVALTAAAPHLADVDALPVLAGTQAPARLFSHGANG